jgi:hypothetical protein
LSSRLLSKKLKIKVYKTIILLVLYGCETRSLTLREERRLGVFENRVMRGIFGPQREEVAGGWRTLHNEELHILYASSNVISVIKSRRLRWAGHVACTGEVINAYNILVRKREGEKPVCRPWRSWEDNIRMDLREIGWEGVDWIHLAQDRDQWLAVVNTVMNLRVPYKVGNFLTR